MRLGEHIKDLDVQGDCGLHFPRVGCLRSGGARVLED